MHQVHEQCTAHIPTILQTILNKEFFHLSGNGAKMISFHPLSVFWEGNLSTFFIQPETTQIYLKVLFCSFSEICAVI